MLMEERIAQKCSARPESIGLPRAASIPSAIERHVEQFLRDCIDHHVAGAGVEGDYVFELGSRPEWR